MARKDSYRKDLIELIEQEPSIWDHTCDEYSINGRRKNAWLRVTRSMQESGHNTSLPEIQSAWRNLKDLRRKKMKAKTGAAGGKEWPYMPMLTFLEKIDFKGPTMSNLDKNGNFLSYDDISSDERGSTSVETVSVYDEEMATPTFNRKKT
ncbi:hypothetical protein COOONC_25626, partial [Cooperia oncophora]